MLSQAYGDVNIFLSYIKEKNPTSELVGFSGADIQIRTGDLILTKDALYLLSYISIMATRIGFEPTTSSVTG